MTFKHPTADLFPEVEPDKIAMLKRRSWARHQHNRVVDPNDNERYTLSPTLEQIRKLSGVTHFDIDLSACVESHCAPEWLGVQFNGTFRNALTSSWRPTKKLFPDDPSVGFNNMPYDAIEDFIERSVVAMLDGELDVLLSLPPGDRCEQPWWQRWIEPYRDGRGLIDGRVKIETHCLPGRQKFGSPGDPNGLVASSAPFPSVLIAWRFV